jgi:uncharacterized protein
VSTAATGSVRIVVFAKAPLPGFAKTRLIPRLGAEGAARLAERLLAHAAAEADAAALGPVEVWAAPDPSHAAFAQLAGRIACRSQGEGDLGERMARAFKTCLEGFDPLPMLLIGTDAPGLDRHYLRAAADALATHDAVFGPALDGGYTLVGLRRPAPALFGGMPWSTAAVMSETHLRLHRLGIRHAELAPLSDIDEPADLAALPPGWLA